MHFRYLHPYKKMASLAFFRTSFAVFAVFLVFNCFPGHLKCDALDLEMKFSAKIVTEMEVNLPADELWAVFKSPDYMKILARLNPDFYKSVTYVRGNGGVGTILNVTVAPGTVGEYWYDKITELDDKTRTRVQIQLKGRFPNAGFTNFAGVYNIIKTSKSSSIIRFSIVYDLKQQSLSNASLAIAVWDQATSISDYVNSRRSKPVVLRKKFSGAITSDLKVNLPAEEVWKLYKGKDYGYLMLRLMPNYYKQIIYQKGDGGVGTLLNVTIQPALGGTNWLEVIYLVDAKTMTRAIRYVKGRYLDSGFTDFRAFASIIPETKKSCVLRAFAPYKIKPDSLSSVFTLGPFWDQGIATVNYIKSLKN